MLLSCPTVKLIVFQQRRTFTSSLAKRFSFNAQPLTESQAQAALDKECIDFLPWLEQVAGAKITNTLSIGKSPYGRALFASKVIHAGDCILKVPFNAQITPDELPTDIKVSLTDEVGNIGKLAALVMIEINAGQNSRWFPYISRLPQLSDMHSTIFWDENEFSMIRCSAVHKETVKQKARIEREFSLVSQAFKEHLTSAIERPSLENFMYAYTLVGSRAWETSRGISLIPFADFMNHDGLSASIVLTDEGNQLSEVTADRDYSPGDEVLIRYGEFSNATLMLDFGFTLPYNTHDEVQIQMDIPNDDPLRNMKLGLLQTHYTRSVKDINIFHSSYDTFTIKEVKSATGKGIPQSLRAFARLLSCTSPQELNDLSKEAEQNDGRLARLPFKDRSRELEAHKIILAHINSLIVDHSVCIKELGASNFRFESQRLTVRRQMARELIFGELRVLRSAAEWLIHYCTNLFSAP
ncbi:ribulose-1,5 bisphosphate carboxylase/oxygenase large subunit N-methyltransferase, chloroplastic isoform X1 [Brassica rapa]|uniref:ribulose-1,5 bisphosphate carboxylase/oxygenase large subunit N-methyltransferase, chloroplastic isoform X1 n=2 Tax=Brassica campestris TaxID=3711 RepID=UPI0008723D2B|nr:ribulose-1,5 bisphosphate carboxylase/oxygenase large subunit N-methyltransferase, chloroplastic isoform X1 [Brassica rapa]XP_033134473.1 ribulose-1,5 bisphosphate carboxylase/oxygenase large subunit N-methyltransferase, chloroplastic isoform X1 [Brassica rapa]